MKAIFGKKIGMSRIFTEEGESLPVTVIQAGPCQVLQIKTVEKDGYSALKVGYEELDENQVNRPMTGAFEKAGVKAHKYLREIRMEKDIEDIKVGDYINVDVFSPGEKVHVSGISKGLGFQGGVRRHGFAGGPKTHGQSDRLRAPGSIGQSSYPSRVLKGTRMAGRMGNEKVTTKNLTVAKVDPENNLLCVVGSVPGKRNSFVKITGANQNG
jgi:large subunit ribosomal protein L3